MNKKAFTLIEVTVAVALMVMVFGFSGLIFKVSIESYRMGKANSEIMEKVRTITQKLDQDFGGLVKDAPLIIWFDRRNQNINGAINEYRCDQIQFFATGDFSSTQIYDTGRYRPLLTGENFTGKAAQLRGNTARIYYGMSQVDTLLPWQMTDYDGMGNLKSDVRSRIETKRILGKRQHILTPFVTVDKKKYFIYSWPKADDMAGTFGDMVEPAYTDFMYLNNEFYEHDSMSLAQWKNVKGSEYNQVRNKCFSRLPQVRLGDVDEFRITMHKIFCQNVGSFAVQFAYGRKASAAANLECRWFPSEDPDQDGDWSDSHFVKNGKDRLGVYFNMPGTSLGGDWDSDLTNLQYEGGTIIPSEFPKALKFIFRVYDSAGIIEDDGVKGKVFTHIVYID